METKSGQFLRIFISTDESIFYLDDFFSELSNMECPYSCQLSPSYHLCNNYSAIYEDYDIDKAICAKDNFKLYKNHLFNEYVLVSIEFQHYKDKDRDITFTCGKTGLKISSYNINNKGNFISQIHEKIDNVDYSFTLKYKNDEEGELIIGAYPHLYDSKFNEKFFYYSKAGSNKNGVNWVLNFDIIKYDNKSVNVGPKKSLVNIEYGLIQAPFRCKNYFKTNFYGDKCEERFYAERNVTLIHCKSNFDITSFKNLTFILKDIGVEFVLTYKDLFIKENNEYLPLLFSVKSLALRIFGYSKPGEEYIISFSKHNMRYSGIS